MHKKDFADKIVSGEDTLCRLCGNLEGEHSKEQTEECNKRRKETWRKTRKKHKKLELLKLTKKEHKELIKSLGPWKVKIDKILYKKTSWFAPEQWYGYINRRKMIYVRLRHGYLSAEFLEKGKFSDKECMTFYKHSFRNEWGCFSNEKVTIKWLKIITKKAMEKINS